ncbi:GNAT family N-acetyltransferase [Aurantivibrio infirmus]
MLSDNQEVRAANSSELDQVYMLAYKTWGDGKSIEEYLSACRNSKKYSEGQWVVLLDEDVICSAAIIYEAQFGLDQGYLGLGSVATRPSSRNKGYASNLLKILCEKLKNSGAKGIYLHADIGHEFYEKLGFELVQKQGSICMLKKLAEDLEDPINIPSYF